MDEGTFTIDAMSRFKKDEWDKMLTEVKKFKIKNSDVFLLGHLKSGTTWAQEMIWLLVNDFNYGKAKSTFIDERFPILELKGLVPKNCVSVFSNLECHRDSIEFTKRLRHPRCIKSHLAWENLPEEILNGKKIPKIIYIARNVKDVFVSNYKFYANFIKCIDCSLEAYSCTFMNGLAESGGTYWNNVLHFWERRHEPNILFIKYEDMKNNLPEVIEKVARFLNKNLSEHDKMDLAQWLHFDKMKNNPAVNHNEMYKKSGFMRSGKVGSYKNEMSAEIIAKFDKWIEENLKNSDYKL